MLHAQIIPSRNMTVVPLAQKGVTGFLSGTVFFGEMQRGWNSTGDDRAWNAVFGGSVELYRWDSVHVLVTRFATAMLGNAMNEIGFNPRGAVWEENIGFVTRHSDTWGLSEGGLTYRCKHDIDNSDPANSDIPHDTGASQKRVLILGGLYGTSTFDPIHLTPQIDIRVFDRSEIYFLREDNRFPHNSTGLDWSNAWGSGNIGARVDWRFSAVFTAYTRDYISATLFSKMIIPFKDSRISTEGRAEAGIHFEGAAGGIDAFIAWEHLADDFSEPIPRSSNVVSAGLRIAGVGVY